MNRRGFFAQLAGVVVVGSGTARRERGAEPRQGAESPATDPAITLPRAIQLPTCACGYQMYFARREANRQAEIWTCFRCQTSWRVPIAFMFNVEPVPHDAGGFYR